MTATQNTIEVDDDTPSKYAESGISNTTASINSSIKDYVYENGRRYHRYSEGKYTLPNDGAEQDRLDLYHHLCLLMLKGDLFLAPIGPNPQRILDCGTGTGIWALDVGQLYPSCEILGVDLSPIQPPWVFPNMKFEADDLSLEWAFAADQFDLIHSRALANSIRDWPGYLRQMFRCAKPGGWIEVVELQMSYTSDDGTQTEESGLGRYQDAFHRTTKIAGFVFPDDKMLVAAAEDAGFKECRVVTIKQPIGGWPKEKHQKRIGVINTMTAETGFEAYGLALFTRALGMSDADAKNLCEDAVRDVKEEIHAYNHVWHVIAKKPED